MHLPPSMSLQDHWRVSNQHPYCKMCDNAFRDSRMWVTVSGHRPVHISTYTDDERLAAYVGVLARKEQPGAGGRAGCWGDLDARCGECPGICGFVRIFIFVDAPLLTRCTKTCMMRRVSSSTTP